MTFVVSQLGTYEPASPYACRNCGSTLRPYCYPGQYAKCRECNRILLYMGRVPSAPCVTPTGRIDCHGKQVRIIYGISSCDFCGQTLP